MPQAVASRPRLFADDTCLLLRASNPTSLLFTLNLKISFLLEWCNSNKLTINPQKYHFLIIPPTKNSNHMDLSVSLKDTTINAENSVKYLGVIIDTNLNFYDHLTAIALKISMAVGVLYKLTLVLPQHALQSLYYSFIHPHLLYGLIVWGSTYLTLNSLSSLQNKVIRTLSGNKYFDRVTPIHLKLKILKLPDLYKFEVAISSITLREQTSPSLSNMLIETHKITSRATRSSNNPNNLHIPKYRTHKLHRSLKYQGVKIWNDLPLDLDIQNLPKTQFKRK